MYFIDACPPGLYYNNLPPPLATYCTLYCHPTTTTSSSLSLLLCSILHKYSPGSILQVPSITLPTVLYVCMYSPHSNDRLYGSLRSHSYLLTKTHLLLLYTTGIFYCAKLLSISLIIILRLKHTNHVATCILKITLSRSLTFSVMM